MKTIFQTITTGTLFSCFVAVVSATGFAFGMIATFIVVIAIMSAMTLGAVGFLVLVAVVFTDYLKQTKQRFLDPLIALYPDAKKVR